MDPVNYQELLARYLKGNCTEEERALLDQWYESLDTDVALPFSDEEKEQLLAKNWSGLAARTTVIPLAKRFRFNPYWAAAALVILISGLSWYFLRSSVTSVSPQQEQVSEVKQSIIERINTSAVPEKVVLSDRSIVTLQPDSKIRYPVAFASQKREVTLVGEAFFEVQKNRNKPFLVYSHDLITKVLGTSFRIKAYPTDRNVTVAVRTGRVSVYSLKLASLTKSKSDPETIGIVLTPNQQVTYLDQEHRLVKTLVDKPIVLLQKAELTSFTFQNAPVTTIMAAIEKTYGIDIVYDEEVMGACFITTSLDQESLFDKLTIICKLLGATYKVIDARIVITGPGC